jgi:hypothetical protein
VDAENLAADAEGAPWLLHFAHGFSRIVRHGKH